MGIYSVDQNSFSRGEVGPYMRDRINLDRYQQSAEVIENAVQLPLGGLQRRRGFENLYTFDAAQEDFKLVRFSFNREQEYLLIFADGRITVFRNNILITEIDDSPFKNMRDLNFTQVADVLIIVHPNYNPHRFTRFAENNWVLEEIPFKQKPFVRYDLQGTVDPSATTGTITLSAAGGYLFNVARSSASSTYQIKINGGVVNVNPVQPISISADRYFSFGGSASSINIATLQSEEQFAYAILSSTSAHSPNAVYEFAATAKPTSCLLELGQDATHHIVITSYNETAVSAEANLVGTVIYENVAERFFEDQLKEIRFSTPTSGITFQVSFQTEEDVAASRYWLFNGIKTSGEVVRNGDLENDYAVSALSTSNQTAFIEEEAWSEYRGGPLTATVHNQRLVFGGTRDRPSSLFGSVVGDYFNFTDVKPSEDDLAWKFDIASNKVETIRNIQSQQNLHVFTSEAEWIIQGDANKSITPTTVKVTKNSDYGSARTPLINVDGEIFFTTANGKEVRSFDFSFANDRYDSQNLTMLAHHLFSGTNVPVSMAHIRGLDDTQANLIFVPRRDGTLCVLTYDNAAEIMGWNRWLVGDGANFVVEEFENAIVEGEVEFEESYYRTSKWGLGGWRTRPATRVAGVKARIPIGEGVDSVRVKDVATVNANLGNGTQEYLYALIGFNGTNHLVVYGEKNVYLDNFVELTSVSATTYWDDPAVNTWFNSTIDVIGTTDNETWVIEQGIQTDEATGSFTTQYPYTQLYFGLPYTTTIQPNKLNFLSGPNRTLRDKPIFLKKAIIGVQNAFEVMVGGFRKNFNFNPAGFPGFDRLIGFSGKKEVSIAGRSKENTYAIQARLPVPFTLTSITTKGKIDDDSARR